MVEKLKIIQVKEVSSFRQSEEPQNKDQVSYPDQSTLSP